MNSRAALVARAVRGPILLICIGTLFAMHQSGIAPFSRTWPLLIIVFGVLKLLERVATPQSAAAGPWYPPPPAGSPPPGPEGLTR